MRSTIPAFPAVGAAVAACILSAGAAAQAPAPARDDIPVRGVVRPLNQASISSEIGARIIKLTRKEGEPFHRGDVIVEFDCRRHRAEYSAAEAAYREAKLAQDSHAYLQRHQAGGKFEVETSKARADKMGADAEGLRVRLDQCTIIAPFDGRVAELSAFEHEIPQSGKPFLKILDDSSLEIEVIVPSTWLRWLKPGTQFNFIIDETGAQVTSKVVRIGAAVDPVSQTVKVIGSAEARHAGTLAGMSGTAHFQSGH